MNTDLEYITEKLISQEIIILLLVMQKVVVHNNGAILQFFFQKQKNYTIVTLKLDSNLRKQLKKTLLLFYSSLQLEKKMLEFCRWILEMSLAVIYIRFVLWGTMKDRVYKNAYPTVEEFLSHSARSLF